MSIEEKNNGDACLAGQFVPAMFGRPDLMVLIFFLVITGEVSSCGSAADGEVELI